MWSYYGAKTNIVDLYPKPRNRKIIEPFAGSARYALKYFDRDVLLVDKYEVIINIWKWLQKCSPNDILKMPRKLGMSYDEIDFDCLEARHFYSFLVSSGDQMPRNKPTSRKTVDRPNHANYNLQRVARQLFKIRHWDISLGSYDEIINQPATWFIDPPYQYGGYVYKESSKNIDFNSLKTWCESRQGQSIVCENTKATWMDFKPIIKQRGSIHSTTEAIWSNHPSAYDTQQLTLF